jgi:hypothetical protein
VRLDSAANASTPHRHGTVCSSAARDVESSGPGSSVVEVDEPDGFTIPEHGVPRPKIAVAHDVGRVHRRTRVEGFIGRETGDRDVIIAQQPRERPQPRLGHYVCPAVGATLARDEAHDFVAVDDVEQARSRKPDRRHHFSPRRRANSSLKKHLTAAAAAFRKKGLHSARRA